MQLCRLCLNTIVCTQIIKHVAITPILFNIIQYYSIVEPKLLTIRFILSF